MRYTYMLLLCLILSFALSVTPAFSWNKTGRIMNVGDGWTIDTSTADVCILKLGTTTNWTWNSATLTATAPGTLVITTEVKVPTISGADGVDAQVLSGGKTTLTTATVTGGLNVGAATLAGTAGQISAKRATAGTMLMLNDSVETGGADTKGRFYVESSGTEADSDVTLGFWDSDAQAYRTLAWDNGLGRFTFGNESVGTGTLYPAATNCSQQIRVDYNGNGSESALYFTGTVGAGNDGAASLIRACDPADGTNTTPWTGLGFWGPAATGSSVEMMRMTTTAVVCPLPLQHPAATGFVLTLSGDSDSGIYDNNAKALYYQTDGVYKFYMSGNSSGSYKQFIIGAAGNGLDASLGFAGTVGAGNSDTALTIRACDPADGTNTTPWTGWTFLGPGATAASVEAMRVTTTATSLFAALVTPRKSALTVASDAITVTGAYHTIAAEGGVADTLSTINGGVDGARLTLRGAAAVAITIDEAGNILVPGASVEVNNTGDIVEFIYSAGITKWVCTGFTDNN